MSVVHHRDVTVIFFIPDYLGSTQTVHRLHCQQSLLEILLLNEEVVPLKTVCSVSSGLSRVTGTPFWENDFAAEVFKI